MNVLNLLLNPFFNYSVSFYFAMLQFLFYGILLLQTHQKIVDGKWCGESQNADPDTNTL